MIKVKNLYFSWHKGLLYQILISILINLSFLPFTSVCFWKFTQVHFEESCFFPIYSSSVTRRCFPALGRKGNLVTVGNQTNFEDADGKIRDAKDLVDGVKWVLIHNATRAVIKTYYWSGVAMWKWISSQECYGGHRGSSSGDENLWGFYAVLVLDPHVSK